MARGPEHEWADLWADWMRVRGFWVQKLGSSDMAGLPDYLVGHSERKEGVRFVEAKAVGERQAFHPDWLRLSQHWFLERVHNAGGQASLLIVGPESFLELRWDGARYPMPRWVFDVVAHPYD